MGALVLDGRPHIAVVIDRKLPSTTLEKLPSRGADLLEVRLDLFAPDFDAAFDYIADIRKTVSLPLLGTIRPNEHTGPQRMSLFTRLLPLVDAVDIEFDADICAEVIAESGIKTVIASEHDFVQTPSTERLQAIADRTRASGADIVKIAAMAHSSADVARLMTFCSQCEHPMIAIAMGEHGLVSRLIAPLFGSLFSYSFVSESVAPGQMSLDNLAAEMARYYPSRRFP